MNNQEQKNQKQPVFFGKEQASSYDQQWAKLAPIRDALHLLLRIRLSELPNDAHILCIGVGTGSELLITQQEKRRDFFGQISTLLCPGGYLVSADLASGRCASAYENLFEVWLQMQRFTGVPEEKIEKMHFVYGRDVAVSAPQEIEELIASSGFDTPVLFFQAFLIHAWYARRTA